MDEGFMDHLRSTTFLATLAGAPAALALLVPQAALADTTISTSQTTPVRTSTAGNVTIASGGTILLANGGTAATVDSNNTVTVASGGAITNTGGKTGDAGIVVEPGRSTTISNAGTIMASLSAAARRRRDRSPTAARSRSMASIQAASR
ncbi:MAG: hypothetical protein B7X78_00900 [Sphingomonadales bacterium 39-62-4]|nr:MAG: hypothetical protein B7X78_00900 [Sphingomonadales bacterium 39-62-4]